MKLLIIKVEQAREGRKKEMSGVWGIESQVKTMSPDIKITY